MLWKVKFEELKAKIKQFGKKQTNAKKTEITPSGVRETAAGTANIQSNLKPQKNIPQNIKKEMFFLVYRKMTFTA